ncbi:DNA transporter [Nocardia mangyaensis]|uniref:DNA transporter n=1 Tax=Nocardia mangyaensis TaxID=2213200 RepID=A0A1J0VXW9_9NOCA|nr:LOG family protein [Nocardia mangyaensis]APE36853.1 DNA transporter [Nocardia mangyaensis]
MSHRFERPRTASFFGGVVPASEEEETLANDVGRELAAAGFVLQHGGYNGLMEAAAGGASAAGGEVVAVTLADVDWGEFNPYVSRVIRVQKMGDRLHQFLDDADVVVAMGGGVGTLHEITAAFWYSGNVRPVPVWLVGQTAMRLAAFLRSERWLFESPTRSLGFLSEVSDSTELRQALSDLTSDLDTNTPVTMTRQMEGD